MPGVHAVLTHDDVPGREALRARVRRPAGARDRPRPLLRRAGRARRRRASRAGAPRRRADPRRVRAARAGRRHGARDRARPTSTPSSRRTATATATTTRPNVVRHIVIRHGDPDAAGDVVGRAASTSIGIQDQAFLGPESGLAVPDGEGGVDIYVATQWLHVDRAPGRALPRPAARAGARSTSPASAARSAAARTSRCRSTARCSRCTRTGR